MHNLESSYKNFFQLSVSTGNILTSDYGRVSKTKIGYKRIYETDYERVYETEIGRVYETEISYSIFLTTTGFHWLSAHGDGQIFFPNSTHPTQVEKAAEHTGN